jgi:hypothetical protein
MQDRKPSRTAPVGPLRALLEAEAAAAGVSLKDLTVLKREVDPFRVDIDARHRDGKWLKDAADQLGFADRPVHLRGLHYAAATKKLKKPNGEVYQNNADDWTWLQRYAGKAARWLGYIPFDQIIDERNAEPVERLWTPLTPEPYLTVDIDIQIPDIDELLPSVGIRNFFGAQPFKLVLFGEKSSLEPILDRIAAAYRADLYLPTGEISDTLLYRMAKVGADDGRPMRVVCFSDADPSGWQMPISIARKLQAFKARGVVEIPDVDDDGNPTTRQVDFGALEFQVIRAALTPDQVRAHKLPDSPLKEKEKRADRWKTAMGIEQTEIDALAALQPDLLRRIARETLDPFYDHNLGMRVEQAYQAWTEQAAPMVTEQLGPQILAQFRADAVDKLAAVEVEVEALKDALQLDTRGIRLPPAVVPDAELDGKVPPAPLVDSAWSFTEQTRRLRAAKAYTDDDEEE